jgi:hypothetical protein
VAELFRYIEQSFVVPSPTRPIDVGRESDQQNRLRGAISQHVPPDRIRGIANDFILKHFSSPVADPFQLGKKCLSFAYQLLALPSPGKDAIDQLVSKVFDSDARTLVGSKAFVEDKALLDDSLVSVKIATAFDRVNAHDLVAMRQTIAFLDDFAVGTVTDITLEGIPTTLRRPIRIPSEFVKSLTVNPDPAQPRPAPDPAANSAAQQRTALMAQQSHLQTAYETIMSLQPDQFELKPLRTNAGRPLVAAHESAKEVPSRVVDMVNASPTFLAISQAAVERLGDDVRQTLEKAYIDLSGSSVSDVIMAIKRQWQEVSRQLAPFQVPMPAKVFRVGVHLFAVQNVASTTVADSKEKL